MTPTDVHELLETSDCFCLAPWVHLHVGHDAPPKPCQAICGTFAEGSTSPDRAWNHEDMRRLRLHLLAGERQEQCSRCYEAEAHGASSLRQSFNRWYANFAGRVLQTSEDGELEAAPIACELSPSNQCDLRCRSCCHALSSSWFEDARLLGERPGDLAVVRRSADPRSFLDGISSTLDDMTCIHFTGGEPLSMEEHILVVEELIRRQRTDVRLSYSTSLSTLVCQDEDILDLWSQFESVRVVVSVDAWGERGEIVRKGLVWSTFLNNVESLVHRCPHVRLMFQTTVSVFNALHFPLLHRRLVEREIAKPYQFALEALQYPRHYAIQTLTNPMKDLAREQWMAQERWARGWYSDHPEEHRFGLDHYLGQLDALTPHLEPPARRADQIRFRETTAKLDLIREDRTREFFPELAPLFAW